MKTLLLLLLVVAGCASPKYSGINVQCYNPDLRSSAGFWAMEASRVYPNCVLVLGHGDKKDGEWCIFPYKRITWPTMYGFSFNMDFPQEPVRVESVVKAIHSVFPKRMIVLIVCNEYGFELREKNVVYAKSKVWVTPDKYQTPRSMLFPTNVGSIYEFSRN